MRAVEISRILSDCRADLSQTGGRIEKEKNNQHLSASVGQNDILFNVFGEEKKKSVDCVCLKCLCSVLFVQSILSRMKSLHLLCSSVFLTDDDGSPLFVCLFVCLV